MKTSPVGAELLHAGRHAEANSDLAILRTRLETDQVEQA
jgi:hypothetical protein